MKKSKKLKRAMAITGTSAIGTPHDRRSTDLLINARVAAIQVDDPLEPGAKLIVLRSLRDDPLAALHNAGQIDECQFVAGRYWQRAFEVAQGTTLKAIDPAKEAVDGGSIPQPTVSNQQARAIDDLKKATKALGMEGESIVMDVLGRGATLTVVAVSRGCVTEAERKYIGKRFRECLDTMAWVFGLSTTKKSATS